MLNPVESETVSALRIGTTDPPTVDSDTADEAESDPASDMPKLSETVSAANTGTKTAPI